MLTPTGHAHVVSQLHARAVVLLSRMPIYGGFARREFAQVMVLRDYMLTSDMLAHVAPFPTPAPAKPYSYDFTLAHDDVRAEHHTAILVAARSLRPRTVFFMDGTHETTDELRLLPAPCWGE